MRKLMIMAVLCCLGTTMFSQAVAAVDRVDDPIVSYENAVTFDLNILESPSYFTFQSFDYNEENETLELKANKEVTTFSIYKDGEVYLHTMPIFSKNLNVSFRNFENGIYHVHMFTEGETLPVIVEMKKLEFN